MFWQFFVMIFFFWNTALRTQRNFIIITKPRKGIRDWNDWNNSLCALFHCRFLLKDQFQSQANDSQLIQCQLFMLGTNRTHGALGSFAAFAEPDLKNLLEQEIHLRTLRIETETVRWRVGTEASVEVQIEKQSIIDIWGQYCGQIIRYCFQKVRKTDWNHFYN